MGNPHIFKEQNELNSSITYLNNDNRKEKLFEEIQSRLPSDFDNFEEINAMIDLYGNDRDVVEIIISKL